MNRSYASRKNVVRREGCELSVAAFTLYNGRESEIARRLSASEIVRMILSCERLDLYAEAPFRHAADLVVIP
jgi:hypothetical protein